MVWGIERRQLSSELARIAEGFPSCNRSHCAPTFLPLFPDSSSTSKVHNREEIKRISGLSVFVEATKEVCTLKSDKPKRTASPFDQNSDCRTWCKSIWSSTKRKPVRIGPVFFRKKGKVVFNFQHFVEPERIIEEYTRANIHNRPRFVKIPKKEKSEKRASPDVDFNRSKSKPDIKCEKPQIETDISEKKTVGWRLNKSTESLPRRIRRTPKKISATHNFVFEFNPFATAASVFDDNNSPAKGLQNFGQGDISSKQQSKNVQPHTTASLPKLPSHCDAEQSNSKKRKDRPYKKTNLPSIKTQEEADQGFAKNYNDTRLRNSMDEISREVEEVKSSWQMLKKENGWIRRKPFNSNSRSKKLYETLEKMTHEISKIEKSYTNPQSNRFLQRASKAVNVSQPSFEEEANKIREVLFPKESSREKIFDTKIADETLSSIPSDALKQILSRETLSRSMKQSKQLDTRSLITNPRAGKVKNLVSENDLPWRIGERAASETRPKPKPINYQKTAREISTNIDRYLDHYVGNAEKHFVNKEETKAKNLQPSPDDMTEMLKRLNLQTFDMYDIGDSRDDSEKDSLSNSVRKVEGMRFQNSLRTATNSDVKSNKVSKEMTTQCLDPKENDFVQENNKLSFDTSIQTNTEVPLKNNTFIGMSLSTLSSSVPRHTLSRILQSEYLKKDMSLKPM